jgi:hypothetical protein
LVFWREPLAIFGGLPIFSGFGSESPPDVDQIVRNHSESYPIGSCRPDRDSDTDPIHAFVSKR